MNLKNFKIDTPTPHPHPQQANRSSGGIDRKKKIPWQGKKIFLNFIFLKKNEDFSLFKNLGKSFFLKKEKNLWKIQIFFKKKKIRRWNRSLAIVPHSLKALCVLSF